MINQNMLIEEIKSLPDDIVSQVYDHIVFLKTQNKRAKKQDAPLANEEAFMQAKVKQQQEAFDEFFQTVSSAEPLREEFDEAISQGVSIRRETNDANYCKLQPFFRRIQERCGAGKRGKEPRPWPLP
ncbi:MAG: hypothetical protein FWG66_09390 [Spirochaetes bacterium]|nr:hypothetical protein [Spirochaetota bacterium]